LFFKEGKGRVETPTSQIFRVLIQKNLFIRWQCGKPKLRAIDGVFSYKANPLKMTGF
jgi:hypothetical protein